MNRVPLLRFLIVMVAVEMCAFQPICPSDLYINPSQSVTLSLLLLFLESLGVRHDWTEVSQKSTSVQWGCSTTAATGLDPSIFQTTNIRIPPNSSPIFRESQSVQWKGLTQFLLILYMINYHHISYIIISWWMISKISCVSSIIIMYHTFI